MLFSDCFSVETSSLDLFCLGKEGRLLWKEKHPRALRACGMQMVNERPSGMISDRLRNRPSELVETNA